MDLNLFVDWYKLVDNLHRKTKSYDKIVEKSGVKREVLVGIKKGDIMEPSWWDAIKLLDYHYDVMPLKEHLELSR